MQLNKEKIERILKEYKKDFQDFEHYDKTHKKLWGRERIDITLNRKVIKNLKDLKEKTGKSVSRIIEDAVSKV